MAKITYSIIPEDGYEGDYNIEAYKQSAPTVKVGETPEPYPHSNPMVGEIDVPSTEPYFVRVRAVECDEIVEEFPVVPPVAGCPAPGEVTISSITENTATASWVAATSPPADGYDWRLVRMDGLTEVPVTSGNTSSLSRNLTGLLGSNSYRFYVKSKCSSELSSAESVGNFTTSDPEPDPEDYHYYQAAKYSCGCADLSVAGQIRTPLSITLEVGDWILGSDDQKWLITDGGVGTSYDAEYFSGPYATCAGFSCT